MNTKRNLVGAEYVTKGRPASCRNVGLLREKNKGLSVTGTVFLIPSGRSDLFSHTLITLTYASLRVISTLWRVIHFSFHFLPPHPLIIKKYIEKQGGSMEPSNGSDSE